jgi:hypothetical protein
MFAIASSPFFSITGLHLGHGDRDVFIGLSSSFLGTIISTIIDDINRFHPSDLERGSTIIRSKAAMPALNTR